MGARPTYRQVAKLLAYDPRTGRLTWRVSRGGRRAGDGAGHDFDNDGSPCRMLSINNHRAYGHQIAWLLMRGAWPRHLVQAKDGDLRNLRWSNLEPMTIRQRRLVQKIRSDNTSGTKGVCYHVRYKRWIARAWEDGRQISLGYFDSKEEAVTARHRHVDVARVRQAPGNRTSDARGEGG